MFEIRESNDGQKCNESNNNNNHIDVLARKTKNLIILVDSISIPVKDEMKMEKK